MPLCQSCKELENMEHIFHRIFLRILSTYNQLPMCCLLLLVPVDGVGVKGGVRKRAEQQEPGDEAHHKECGDEAALQRWVAEYLAETRQTHVVAECVRQKRRGKVTYNIH